MKYCFMKKYSQEHCISKMAKVLKVNRSGYYKWLEGIESEREKDNYLKSFSLQIYNLTVNVFQRSMRTEEPTVSLKFAKGKHLRNLCLRGRTYN